MGQCTCHFLSYTLGRAVTVEVILPGPVFLQKAPSHVPTGKYPVLYLLQGTGWDETAWLRRTSIERYAEARQIAAVTLPTENSHLRAQEVRIPFGRIGIEADSPLADHRIIRWEDFFLQELSEYITATFPISTHQTDTYLAGCGNSAEDIVRIVQEHPGRFAAIGLLGGKADRKTAKALGDSDTLLKQIFIASENVSNETADKVVMKELLDHWDGYDWAIERFINGLPRTDVYADQPPRRI